MAEIESLLTKYIEQHIDSQLGQEMTMTIKKRIFDRYGISLTEAIKQYEPFDKTLREFFGRAADGVISRLFNKVCLIKKDGKNLSFHIKDKKLAELLLESYGDKNKKEILLAVTKSAMSISKILKNTNISSQTTGYRIINDMIKDGLLVESGYDVTPDGKRTQAYITPIKKINVAVGERPLDVVVELAEEFVAKSGFLNTIFAK